MKKILTTAFILGSVHLCIASTGDGNKYLKIFAKDICSITYITTEHIGNTVVKYETTISATTCEEVEQTAIKAGIIKPKSIASN
jgi:hypothetical protein